MPNSEFITISKKIEKEQERERLTNIVKCSLPKGYGIIIRTAANGKKQELIQKDIEGLVKQYNENKNQNNRLLPANDYTNHSVGSLQ